MCGRFSLKASADDLAEFLGLDDFPTLEPRFNMAPSQYLLGLRVSAQDKNREICLLRWGLIPSWARDEKIGMRTINARSETAAQKPSFRGAMKRRRCVIPADGFYEWQRQGQRKKQPHRIIMKDGSLFGMAGLWDTWMPPDGGPIETCSILTTAANALVGKLHDRMPVILDKKNFSEWMDPKNEDPKTVQQLLRPFPAEAMDSYPVGLYVNSPKNEGPQCVEPLAPPTEDSSKEQGLLFE